MNYANNLRRHEHETYKQRSYGYYSFDTGVAIDKVARSLMAEALQSGLVFPDPHHVHADPSFFAWINGPARAGDARPVITRYLYALYKARPDLRRAFPHVFQQPASFVSWAKEAAAAGEFDLAYSAAAFSPLSTGAPSGVNVAGYLTAELGVGEAARGYIVALKALNMPLALTNFAVGTASRNQDQSLSGFTDLNPHPINVLCINADQVPSFLATGHQDYLEDRYNIGVWWWELPEFPNEWQDRFAQFDELWVGSSFTQDSIAKSSPIPVVRVPPVVQVEVKGEYTKSHFGLYEEEYTFLFVFDFFSIFERKNPLAVLKAFKVAFAPTDKVRLVFKCINGDKVPEDFARMQAETAGARVTLVNEYLSRDEKNGLIAVCDCYISLHRSEGFGLTLAEAMFLGKPVIATGWSGNMDFMTISNSYPVSYELVELTADQGPYKRGQRWAEPNIKHAASLMREVFDRPDDARARGRQASVDIGREHSPERVAYHIKGRLGIVESAQARKQTATAPARPRPKPHKGKLLLRILPPIEIVMQPGFVEFGSRYGAPGIFAKRALRAFYQRYFREQLTATTPSS